MEVLILSGLIIVVCIGFSIHLYSKNSNLREEVDSLGNILKETINDFERDLQDHRDAERELSIVKAKLETVKESNLTPDNAVPKDMHTEQVLNLTNELSAAKLMLNDVKQKLNDEKGKHISERVRLGQIGEQFATLHDQFKYNRKEAKAILQPIDFVCFEDDEVVFVEVKTGGSKLSSKQKKIKENINQGRVKFEVFRIDENGAHWGDK